MIARVEQQKSPKGWNSGNLHGVPPVIGVYVLRDQNQNILFIGSVGSRRLRDRLIGHLQVNDVPGVRYFEWYQTDGPRRAREQARQWIARYQPPFVRRRRRAAETVSVLS
jgi:excinuclease UvrABC nuclease subunit